MTDRSEPRRRRAWGLLGMLVLVGSIEAVVGSRHDLTDPVAMQWRYRGKAILTKARQAEVLCLGDSLVKFGVAAPELSRRLGRPVGNHAVLAAPAAASYFALKDALGAGAKPRLVIVDYAPFLLLPGYRLNRAFLPEMAGLGASLDLALTTAEPELAGTVALGWLVPSVRNRDTLRAGIERLVGKKPAAHPTRTRRPDLWLPGDNEAVFDWFYATDWQAGTEHESYIDRMMTLARDHGATVVWLMPPVSDPIRREWDALGLATRYTNFAAAVQARHPNLVVLDGRQLVVTNEDLLDPLHLNPRGAETFTARLATFLPWIERGPRWVDMTSTAESRWAMD